MSLFKTKIPEKYGKQTIYGSRNRPSKLKIQKQFEDIIIKNVRNFFKLKKKMKQLKERIIRDIRTLFEQGDDYYKPVRAGNFWNKNYIEYTSNGDTNKKLWGVALIFCLPSIVF